VGGHTIQWAGTWTIWPVVWNEARTIQMIGAVKMIVRMISTV
jgi:hypothetical protein